MFKQIALVFCALIGISVSASAWTNCPPASLPANPSPVAVGKSSCIVEADWVQLTLNEKWTRKVKLEAGQSYWFSGSKCARASSMASEVRDEQNNVVKSDSGSSIGYCFRAPITGTYTLSYWVTRLNGSYSFAITSGCLSKSSCKP